MPKDVKPNEDKVYSEYSMGLFDFKRLDTLLCYIDEYGFKVRLEPGKYIRPYFSVLKQLYVNLRPLLYDGKRKEFDELLKNTQPQIFKDKKISQKLIVTLEEFNISLMELRQDVGLGLTTSIKRSEKKRAKNAWGE